MTSRPSPRPAALLLRGLAVVALAAFPAAAFAQEKPVAFTGARILPIAGEEIADGTLVVHKGKILAVGRSADVRVPDGADRVEARGKVIMPGLVDTHSHVGGPGGGDQSSPINPDVRVYDSINALDPGFKRALSGGLTTLNVMPGSGHLMSGQTVYLKLRDDAKTIDDLLIVADDGWVMGGMKMANGTNPLGSPPFPGTRGKSAALVRQHYIKAQEYRDKLRREPQATTRPATGASAASATSPATQPATQPSRDLGMEAMLEVLDGRRVVHHHTHRADDIATVLRLQKEFGFRVVLHHVSEASRMAEEIAAAKVPCSIILVDAPGGKLEAVNLVHENAPALEKAGVLTAFHTDDYITDSRLFLRMAGLGVRAGMSRKAALEAMTINGARMLDLQDRVGTLEAGKDADFVILSGDPLSVYTQVEQTWVEGRKAFDRADEKDRLYAVGGYGAGHDQTPYFCCFGHDHAGAGAAE